MPAVRNDRECAFRNAASLAQQREIQSMSELQGGFIWYELLTSNVVDATHFYSNVVGWSAESMHAGCVTYQLFKTDTAPVAALIDTSAGADSSLAGWISYLGVENVDAVLEGVIRLGGTVRQAPSDAPDIGRFAIIADPQGALLGLFAPTPDNPGRAPPYPAPTGHVGWHELYTSDPDAAFAFYSEAFGWKKDHAFEMGAAGPYQLFSIGGRPVGGIMRKPHGVPTPLWNPFIQVADIMLAEQHITARSGKVFDGPREVPGGDWTLKCIDPQGAMFALTAHRG